MSAPVSHTFMDCTYPAGCTGCIPDGMTFAQWMVQVDRVIGAACGLTHLDLADWNYRDAFDSEVTPEEAAESVLEEEGFPL